MLNALRRTFVWARVTGVVWSVIVAVVVILGAGKLCDELLWPLSAAGRGHFLITQCGEGPCSKQREFEVRRSRTGSCKGPSRHFMISGPDKNLGLPCVCVSDEDVLDGVHLLSMNRE